MEEKLIQLQTSGTNKLIKIALFGPESTGKTTLASQLAIHYKTVWVTEYAREYLQKKWENDKSTCLANDLLPIAYGQIKLENDTTLIANKYLFCDTNLMVTKVFSEINYNFCHPEIDLAAKQHHYDLYFLTNIDTPWEKDDIRDSPKNRETVFEIFKRALIENKKPFIIISGNKEERLKTAIKILDEFTLAKTNGISADEFVQIYNYGITIENVLNQLNIFKNKIKPIILDRPATILDGILRLSKEEFQTKATFFDANKGNLKLKKFVPASGAATRMFNFLNDFLNEYDFEKESINGYINRKNATELSLFIIGMNRFPFFEMIEKKLRNTYSDYDLLDKDYKNYYFIEFLLKSKDFDFNNKPKGVIPFHKYETYIATPIEEHLKECVNYASVNGNSNLHFTVSEKHKALFENSVNSVKNKIETETNVQIFVEYSFQNKATDTVAVDAKNKLLKNNKDELIFRPGGHGALIDNLNKLKSDLIFIKNIDNITQNHDEKITLYKKALAGILIELQQQIFEYLITIKENEIDQYKIAEILLFMKEKLSIQISKGFYKYTIQNQISKIKSLLNKPIRVCGMVKNEGEAGGGPFWVKDEKGHLSLQIVESSQVNLQDKVQEKILKQATHFNPVDLVCGLKNYKGKKFKLQHFINPNSGFIVKRNLLGKSVKTYELPGLWNGAMAKWITIFVEVPLITFNPVKTVNDLLKSSHQLK